MLIDVAQERSDSLDEYASISIAFRVTEVVDRTALRTDGSALPLITRQLARSYVKDYDAYPGNAPLDWPTRFDVSEWGFFAAYVGSERIGGAVVIANDGNVDLLEGRNDLALLWDLRVAPRFRRFGVASALLTAAEVWARARASRVLLVETQNINVAACRFYARHSFSLRAVNEHAYAEFPNEIQLLWYKTL